MTLRPYQQDAFNAAVAHMRRSVMPGLLELATGAGKSHIVAAVAQWLNDNTGKRVLCLQPSKELTEQNHEKYLATGNKASIFSASTGSKCMRHPVVYGTPGTVKNSLSRFGDQFCAVIIDEAHGIAETIKIIVDALRKANPMLRVLGMTATPYRTGTGYIYQYGIDGQFVPEDQAASPWFNDLLYRITTGELVDMGFLTPAHADPDHAASYEASGLEVNRRGQFDAREVEQVFEGRGRLTAEIVRDVVQHSAGRRGVMLFAATVQHAKEIMESLPPDISRMIGGDVNMRKSERQELIADFKAQRFKYLVSVGTLTTGFDAPHVDVIAILRATESPGLLQQIIGRGLRLHPGKDDCLVLDYAENIERHGLHDDLFQPDIKARLSSVNGEPISAECEACGHVNEFGARENPERFEIDRNGYFIDLAGERVQTEHGPMPAHLGRRCTGQVRHPDKIGVWERCGHRWTAKECPECEADNDIAARYCYSCKAELVDPNEKLKADFVRVKKDPRAISTDEVLSWTANKSMSQSGNETLRCEYATEYRSFAIWYNPEARHPQAIADWEALNKAVYRGHVAPDIDTFLQYLEKGTPPQTITYAKRGNFFRAYAYNKPADMEPAA